MIMITQMDASNVPEFCALVMQRMLLTLGGQVTMSIEDLSAVAREYPSIRVALDPNTHVITLTLLTAGKLYRRNHGEEG